HHHEPDADAAAAGRPAEQRLQDRRRLHRRRPAGVHGAADAVSEDLHGMAPAANAGQGRRELASLVGGALAAMLLRAGPTRSRLKPLLQVGAAPGFRRSGFSRDAFDASPTRSRLKPPLQAEAAPGFRRTGSSPAAFSMRAPPNRC